MRTFVTFIGGRALNTPIEDVFPMPSKTAKQKRFMAAAAGNKKFAEEAGIPPRVAKEFHAADKKKSAKKGKKR